MLDSGFMKFEMVQSDLRQARGAFTLAFNFKFHDVETGGVNIIMYFDIIFRIDKF